MLLELRVRSRRHLVLSLQHGHVRLGPQVFGEVPVDPERDVAIITPVKQRGNVNHFSYTGSRLQIFWFLRARGFYE